MEYNKGFFEEENIPDFALQPAKPASAFDTTVYDKLFETKDQPAEAAAQIDEPAVIEAQIDEQAEVAVQIDEQAEASAQIDEPAEASAQIDEPAVFEAMPVSAQLPSDHIETSDVSETGAVSFVQKPMPVGAEAVSGKQKNRKVKYTDFRRLDPVVIHVEEDILITDAKPDMVQMLCIEGSCHLNEQSVSAGIHGTQPVRLTGDLKCRALYTAENDEKEPVIISYDSGIMFRNDCTVKGEPGSTIVFSPNLRPIECERVNERKFRVRAAISVDMREYCDKELLLFEGIDEEEVQCLQDEILFTDIALRKTEITEVSEEIRLKDGTPEIDKILCFNINLAENNKQISGEKAMVNAAVNLNILNKSGGRPAFCKCKTEFTQFIRMDEDILNPLLAGQVSFDIQSCSLTANRDEDGDGSVLCLNMDVATTLEYYRQIREHSIADLYHFTKDVEYDKVRKELNCLCGSGASDISVREIAEIPEQFGKAEQVVYITGSGMIKSQKAAQDKVIVEGVLPVTLVCIGGESGKLPFRIEKEAVFKTSVDMPGCREGMEPDSRVVLKDLWFDQINSRQIAINAEIAVTGYAFDKQSRDLIQMASVKERQGRDGTEPGIIVYVAKEGDSVWKVAKRYHAPVSWIRSVNDLADHEEIKAGAKVLIVR